MEEPLPQSYHNLMIGDYKKTYEFSKKFDLAIIGGSDDHNHPHFAPLTGTKYFDIESFLKSVLRKENIIYAKELNPLLKLKEQIKVVRNY